MTRLHYGCMGLLLLALSLPAFSQRGPWGDPGAMRVQQGQGRDGGGWKKARDAHPPARREEGGGPPRMTPEQREQLRRDLDRANREIYHRKRRD